MELLKWHLIKWELTLCRPDQWLGMLEPTSLIWELLEKMRCSFKSSLRMNAKEDMVPEAGPGQQRAEASLDLSLGVL